MGSDKARLPEEGWPMGVRLCELLRRAGLTASLIRRGSPDGLPWIYPDGSLVRVLREEGKGERHPLNGMITALEDAQDDVIVVPCDVLDLRVQDICQLMNEGPGIARGEVTHPLVAHVPFSLLPALQKAVRNGASARRALRELPEIGLKIPLVDRNRADSPWPFERLRARLHWLSGESLQRVARSERTRAAARGVVDPSCELYACDRKEA